MGKEFLRIAAGTEIGHGNLLFGDSRLQEYLQICLPQIQIDIALPISVEDPVAAGRKSFRENLRYFLSDLIAVTADGRPDGADQVLSPAA